VSLNTGLAAASRELRQHPPRPAGTGVHHTDPSCGRRCAAMVATIAAGHLTRTFRQRP
jgi:hypothetical protein